MKNILIINFPGHGHVNPTIKIVKQLVEEGNRVVYYCTEEFKEKLEKVGAIFRTFTYEHIDEKDGRGNNLNIVLDNAINLCDGIMEAITNDVKAKNKFMEKAFDVVIYDSVLSIGEDIKRLLNIEKTVALYTTFGISKELMELGRQAGRKANFIGSKNEVFKEKTKAINEKYNIELKSMLDNLVENEAMNKLVFTSMYYQPMSHSFDNSYKFIGPSIVERGEESDFEIEKDSNKTLIYISLGTIDNKKLDFYKETFKAFGDLEKVNVILSVGKSTNKKDLGEIPKNFKVYNYVPQLEVLKKTDIFITHGGMNSSSEGLYHNIPLVLVPQFGDQFMVARRVESLGAGVLVPKNLANEETLREAVGKIISDDNYKKSAERIGESLKEVAIEAHNIVKEVI